MKKVIVVVIVFSIAVLSFLAGGWYEKKQAGGSGSQGERKILYYIDPMNPGFRSDEPGVAPCGMPLEPVYAEAGEGQAADTGSLPLKRPVIQILPAKH